jgi:hypothetical protein
MHSDEAKSLPSSFLNSSILESWTSLAPEVRAALVASEASSGSTAQSTRQSSPVSSITSRSSIQSDNDEEKVIVEICPETGAEVVMRPLERAPKNVFAISKTGSKEISHVEKTPYSTITTKTTIVTNTKGWRNVFTVPISYDVNMVAYGTLLDLSNPQLLDATGVHSEGYNRRFAVVDEAVNNIYGERIRNYFTVKGIELTVCVLKGGEPDKRPAVSVKTSLTCFLFNAWHAESHCFFLHRLSTKFWMIFVRTS